MDTKIFDSLLEPTFLLNAEKKVIYCNEPAALLTDLSVRKIMRQQPVFDEMFKFEAPLEGLRDLPNVADVTPYQEIKFTTDSGRDGKIQVTFQPFDVGADGKATSWLAYFRDVTLEETLQKKYREEFEQKEVYIKELEAARAKLEDYSRNLEKMVAERTAELSRLNQLMKALLDSLGQGFFIFDQQGQVLEIASKACESTIQTDPRGKKIWEVLALTEKQVPGFQKWMVTLFAEMLPFEDLAPLGPPTFPHSEGKEIQLQYYPLRTDAGTTEGVVVVATDITSLVQAQHEAEYERAHAKMILQLLKNKRQVASFIRESDSMLKELQLALSKAKPDGELVFRLLHTLKGGAATFSVKAFADRCHEAENLLTEWKSLQDPAMLTQLREACDELPGLFGQFLEANEIILGKVDKLIERLVEIPASQVLNFADSYLSLPVLTTAKQALYREFLFEPVGPMFDHYNEVTLNVAERLGKEIAPVQVKTPDFAILPEPYENLFGTLIHAFRNAVDHGIETPDIRQERGKPTAGQIWLNFEQKGPDLFFTIEDDGNGIDPARIREKLAKKGLDVSKETDEQIVQHIFDSQFSTRDEVTDLSGRGVGMDAIADAAKSMGGKVWVESKLGSGTKLCVQVPWITDIREETKNAA